MDPKLSVLLFSWAWRPEIMASLLLAAGVHLTGRWRLKHRTADRAGKDSGGNLTSPWRSISYLGGLAILWIALMSPIDVLSGQYFFMHMIQHLLIVMIAAPLLLLANPMPIMLWGLPETLRLEVGRWLRPGTTFRNTVRAATTPGLVWIYFVVVLVGWHDANAYDATLRYDLVHDIEHLSFFFTAILFWWHVTGAAPHIHRRLSRGLRIGYALSAVPPTALTGLAIAFASEPIYTYYTTVPRLGAMTVMEDQMLGGVIMWVPGSMMYIIAALILIARAMRDEEQEEPWVETQRILSDDEAMRAPGFEESPLQDTGDWGEGQGLGTHSPPSASGGPA